MKVPKLIFDFKNKKEADLSKIIPSSSRWRLSQSQIKFMDKTSDVKASGK